MAYGAEFDTEDPPLQGFTVLQKLCDMLQELGCDDEAKELARATHVLKTRSSGCKPECEAEMSNSSNQSIIAQMKIDACKILHEFSTYCGKEIDCIKIDQHLLRGFCLPRCRAAKEDVGHLIRAVAAVKATP